MKLQQTIENTAEVRGRGLFTGEEVVARFKPAAPDSGVLFVRTDAPTPTRIKAHVSNVTKRARRTSIRNGTYAIETVEHCLAALHGLGIDNIEVELQGGELPGGDGSSQFFVDAIREAGITTQEVPRRPIVVREMVRVTEDDTELIAVPTDSDDCNIVYDLDYGPNARIPRQIFAARVSSDFCDQIASARTFLFEEEAQQFQAAGLGKHLTYSDVVVIGAQGVIGNEFRYPNECVRHKILDLIGDLYLAGRPIYGKILARKSGHALNHELVRRLLDAIDRYDRRARLGSASAFSANELRKILPHRYPFMLVDRVLEIDGDRRAIGIKNVTINEPFFQGHYPQMPIMPGVLILEALAQLSGILLSQKLEHTGKVAVLLSMDTVKFRKPVVPGDQLVLEAETIKVKARTGHVRCRATVNEHLAAQAEIKFMMVDAESPETQVEH
ncbi:MAG TPA: UDP-3-O-acyl-N-acetylglucosamine deacetylase [Phycisphaerae bacterium]|nr:UDP-3-O-acyl-N-acetylglucosamine deacetylase [Phycisphaerae bacterium]